MPQLKRVGPTRLLCTIALAFATPSMAQAPYNPHHAHACISPNDKLPFCDVTLAVSDRVADLISRMSLSEKIAMTSDQGADTALVSSM